MNITSLAALWRRNALEARIVSRLPYWMRNLASRALTYITGMAPLHEQAQNGAGRSPNRRDFLPGWVAPLAALCACGAVPPGGDRELRARVITLVALLVGAVVPGGGLLMLHGMRSFSSVVGHHMTHGGGRRVRLLYDIVSAMFWLPRFDSYQGDHRRHHAYAAGPEDADQQFIAYLGARFDSPVRFVATMLDPRFHAKFAWARVKAVLGTGPVWRRVLALAGALAFGSSLGWVAIATVGFQAATLLQWSTEHLWGRRPAGKNAVETAVAVTYGRLLLPSPDDRWLWVRLAVYAVFRMVFLSGDLPNHDLHHLGRGPWTEAAYVRTRLIEEGRIELRQTAGLRAMFRLAFDSARAAGDGVAPHKMGPDQMLGM